MRIRRAHVWLWKPPNRSGVYDFVDMIRSPRDPERKKRGKEAGDVAPHITIAKTSIDEWAKKILVHLGDGKARTLNRIAVEMIDKTADLVSGTPFHDALWVLVAMGVVEYTQRAPVLFRKRIDGG